MDSLNYNYYKGTNQLRNVRDGVSATNYSNDIDDEPSKYNYRYNGIGQLAKDSAGGIDSIEWSVYGKVKSIFFALAGGVYKTINFVYDPLGNRLEKIISITPVTCFTCMPAHTTYDTTKYVRDAQGNILAVYHRKSDTMHLTEWDIYGSKRIGVVDTNLLVYEPVPACPLCPIITNPLDSATTQYLEGQKQYELTNHLGNVLVTVSDRKMAVDTIAIHTIPHTACFYEPVIINAQDYYPFGMLEPGRTYQRGGDSLYHFGFNGQESDDDIYGEKSALMAQYWEYDSRLGRRWNVDPIIKVGESPYACFANSPIAFGDPNGMDSTQRAKAVNKAKDYADKNPSKDGSQYLKGAKGDPGKKCDCSGLAGHCIKAGDEHDPEMDGKKNGVANIADNEKEAKVDEMQEGNAATFDKDKNGDAHHIMIITNVHKDDQGHVDYFDAIGDQSSTGPNQVRVYTDGKANHKGAGAGNSNYWSPKLHKIYKWDTKPDATTTH